MIINMWQNSYDGSPSVYLVPTPIGNLEDMTFRAIKTLQDVDVIFSEDTRVTLQLLNHFQIKNKLIALHDHNEDTVKEQVLSYLKEGKNVAIVTDRGSPIISDPGYKTVKFLKDNSYNVIGLPGACAFVPAFIGAGMFVNAECLNEVDVDAVREMIEDTQGIVVFDKQVDGGYVSLNDVQGENDIYISRLRQDLSVENGFSFWAVADNLRAGVAKNAFNVMKLLLKK